MGQKTGRQKTRGQIQGDKRSPNFIKRKNVACVHVNESIQYFTVN